MTTWSFEGIIDIVISKHTAESAEINARGVGKITGNSPVADIETRTNI